jgi:DNA-binding MarR family transcriptional regulator
MPQRTPRSCAPIQPEAEHKQTEEFTRLLIEFYERFSSWEQAVVRETGITLQQMHTLEILGSCGNLRMKELAEKMGVTTGSLTVLVDRLERAELVERKPNAEDRRSIRVGLTPAGAKLFEEHHKLHGQLSQDMAGALSPEELDRLLDMLRRLVQHF